VTLLSSACGFDPTLVFMNRSSRSVDRNSLGQGRRFVHPHSLSGNSGAALSNAYARSGAGGFVDVDVGSCCEGSDRD
jgi:hypothetical protein